MVSNKVEYLSHSFMVMFFYCRSEYDTLGTSVKTAVVYLVTALVKVLFSFFFTRLAWPFIDLLIIIDTTNTSLGFKLLLSIN